MSLKIAGLSFLVLYGLGAVIACRWLDRGFAAGPRYIAAGVTALTSVAVSFLGVQLGTMWSMLGEIVRLGNGHFGVYRATRSPWAQHLTAVFAGGVVLFWMIVLFRLRRQKHDEPIIERSGFSGLWSLH